jgi:hypothetical protein
MHRPPQDRFGEVQLRPIQSGPLRVLREHRSHAAARRATNACTSDAGTSRRLPNLTV